MNKRLLQFLSAENISQSQFADTIGVARASVSHIIAGRNKPGFDFIENMSRHYPTLNLDWLIMGKGRMYKDGIQHNSFTDNLFDIPDEEAPQPRETPQTEATPAQSAVQEAKPISTKTIDISQQQSINKRVIDKIVVFYNDGTYQELK